MRRKEVRVSLSTQNDRVQQALVPIVRQIIKEAEGPFGQPNSHTQPEEKKVTLTLAGLEEILYETIFEADPSVMEIELCEGPFGGTPIKRIERGQVIATEVTTTTPEPANEPSNQQPFGRLAGVPRSQRFRGGQR
jgi:hypothetical protein